MLCFASVYTVLYTHLSYCIESWSFQLLLPFCTQGGKKGGKEKHKDCVSLCFAWRKSADLFSHQITLHLNLFTPSPPFHTPTRQLTRAHARPQIPEMSARPFPLLDLFNLKQTAASNKLRGVISQSEYCFVSCCSQSSFPRPRRSRGHHSEHRVQSLNECLSIRTVNHTRIYRCIFTPLSIV